jgi:transposase
LQPGDVVSADNLLSHTSGKAQDILKAQGGWMLSLPPYDPDLYPIELAYPRLKAHLRRLKACTFDALFQSMPKAAISSDHRNAETSSRPPDRLQIAGMAL